MFNKLFSKNLKKELTELNSQYDGLVQVLDNMNKKNSGKQSREDLEKMVQIKSLRNQITNDILYKRYIISILVLDINNNLK